MSDDKLKKLKDKLENNPHLKDEIELYSTKLSEIFETEIELVLKFDNNIDDYYDLFNEYNDPDMFQSKDDTTVRLSQFINKLQSEDDNFRVAIDPLYLDKGINYINNFLITTLNDTIIIVPITKKHDKNEQKDISD